MESKVLLAYKKAVKVIDSCTTPEQLWNAHHYVINLVLLFKKELSQIEFEDLKDRIWKSKLPVNDTARGAMDNYLAYARIKAFEPPKNLK